MQRRVRGVALGHADHPLRHVEALEHRPRAGSPPKRVEAPAVESRARVGLLRLERLRHVVGLDRRAAHVLHKQPAGGERPVADHLGGQPVPRPAGEPHVERIVGHGLGVGDAPLPVGLREHDRLHELLHVPAEPPLGHWMGKPPRQQIEHLGILGPCRLAPKILRALHEAEAEERLPEAVHRHPCEQRMIGIDQPTGEAEAVLGLVGREGGQRRRRVGLDGRAALVVIATLEHVGHLRLRSIPHHHDLRRPFGEVVAAAPRLFQGLTPPRGGFVEDGKIVTEQLSRRLGVDRRTDGPWRERIADLQWRERPIEHPEVVDQTVLEAVIAHPFADPDVVAAAAGDLPSEAVAHHLGGDRVTVHEDLQPARPAGAVARHGHVHPFSHGQWLGGPHARRIPRPEVDQRPAEMAVGDEQLVAPARGVGPGLRTVKHHGPLVRRRGVHPERHRKRMAATEVAHRGLHRMVASELDRLAEPALDEQVFSRRRGRIFRAERIGEHTLVGACIEGEADDLSGNRPGRLTGKQVGHRARAGDPLSHALPHGRLMVGQLGCLFATGFVGLGQRSGRGAVEEARLRRRHRRREK